MSSKDQLQPNFESQDVEEQQMEPSDTSDRIPGYMRPNISHSLPDYINAEQDHIRQAFGIGNYTAISHLPEKMSTDFVTRQKTERIDTLRQSSPPKSPTKGYTARSALFSEFEYVPQSYGQVDPEEGAPYVYPKTRAALEERKKHHEKMAKISNKPFAPADSHAKLPYEYAYPHMPDPFDSMKDDVLRSQWLEQGKLLDGAPPFVPARAQHALEQPTRAVLDNILVQLQAALQEDWPDAEPVVIYNDRELIEVQFNLVGVDFPEAVVVYMNNFLTRNDLVSSYRLVKAVEGWNLKTDEVMIFSFRPPWAKVHVTEPFYALNPAESQRFSVRKATAPS